MTYNEWLEHEIKLLEREKRFWLDNFKRLRDDKIKLKDENKELKEELLSENYKLQNVLIEQQMTNYDNRDYINQLKQELFDLYLKHYN